MTKGLLKSSERKQKLNEKFLKKELHEMKAFIKHINLFLKVERKSLKKNYYIRRLENYQNDIKISWDVIKEIIVRAKSTKGSFPRRMIIDGQEIFDRHWSKTSLNDP